MKTVTIDDVLSCRPCGWDKADDGENYTRARLERLFAGRERVSARDVVAADIPREHAIWLLTRPIFMDKTQAALLALDCAERVLPLFEAERPGDNRPRAAVETKRRHMRGEASNEELDLVARAAWAAVGAVAGAVAGAVEREWQIQRALEYIEADSV